MEELTAMFGALKVLEAVLMKTNVAKRRIDTLVVALERKIAILRKRKLTAAAMIDSHKGKQGNTLAVVLLDVRGRLFEVPKEDLLRIEDSFFWHMLGSDHWQPEAGGSYFIDVASDVFEQVLELMRGEPLRFRNAYEADCLLDAVTFLQLPKTIEMFELPSGAVYIGERAGSKAKGYGVITSTDGGVYIGQFQNDKKDGHGMLTSAGYVYIGFWKRDLRTGQGTYSYPNGDSYEGEWKCGKKEGQGIWKFSSGEMYIGSWKNDHREGHGVVTYAGRYSYEGGWKGGKEEGYGKEIRLDGHIYEGGWREGSYHGQGRHEFPNGVIYNGEWAQKPHGRGTLIMPNGAMHEGNWDNGKMEGEVTSCWVFNDGDVYFGEFSGSKFHGQGTYMYADGDCYTGQWKNGFRCGEGTYVEACGRVSTVVYGEPAATESHYGLL